MYRLKRSSRARHMRITVKPGGACLVIVPMNMPQSSIDIFLLEKNQWLKRAIKRMRTIPMADSPQTQRKSYLLYKEEARIFIHKRIAHINSFYGFSVGRVFVRTQRTRWGSCSRRGNMNFSYKLLFLPIHLADYVIAHELCHLKEFNHSARFWALVAIMIPNHKNARRDLKNYIL